MNYIYYMHFTNIIIYLSLIVLITIVSYCFIKRQVKVFHLFFILFCLFGIYLFLPLRFCFFASVFKNPESVEHIAKFSINPYEKRWCYKYLAQIYKNSAYNKDSKNIDKVIYYMEKAINGNYSKYREDTIILAHWYYLKGDWNNTIKLNNIINNTQGVSLRNAYIMNSEYQKALDSYTLKKETPEEFLIADLYKNVKNHKEAKISFNKAQKIYNFNLNKIAVQSERNRYIENMKKYKTVENYKQWLSKNIWN